MNKVVVLFLMLILAPFAQAQSASYVDLGTDPTGDPTIGPAPALDTWIDINGMAVETVGTDLVFWLGLQGDTTEIGQYCWMAAFEFGGTEYVGLDCYEGIAYTNDNTLSSVSAPDTSRGTNVASSVVFEGSAAKITVPLDAIGASIGDQIDDIYGLTYTSRALYVADTIPDAKSSATADESLGSYIIGGAPMVVEEAPATLTQYLLGNGTFDFAFDNATTVNFVLNWTSAAPNATFGFNWTIANGTLDATLLQDGMELLNSTYSSNATEMLDLTNATGDWQLNLRLHNLTGHLTTNFLASMAPVGTNETVEPIGNETIEDKAKESPGAPLALLAVTVGLVAWIRRR